MTRSSFSSGLDTAAQARLNLFLSQQHPQWENLGISSFTELSEGWETDLYALTLAGERSGNAVSEKLVVRVFRGQHRLEQSEKEFELMKDLARFSVSVPRVSLLVTDQSVLGAPFLVMERIEGPTLEHQLQATEDENLLQAFARTLVDIHSLPWWELAIRPSGPLPTAEDPLAFVRSSITEMRDTVVRYQLSDFEPTLQWLESRKELGSATRPSLIHNDYHPQNVLARNGELVVVDWSFSDVSDYRMDLAWSVLLIGTMIGERHRDAVVEAYESAADERVENLDYFEALKFTQRMLTIATWLDEGMQIPVHKITRQALRGDYKVHVLNPYRRLKEVTGLKVGMIEDL